MTKFTKLEKQIGVIFKDKKLLENVFIHRSYLNENRDLKLESNEKLEFLGDSVLSLVTSVYLYKNYTALSEGIYTDIKASIVRTESLAQAADRLGLGEYLFLSRGEAHGGGRTNKNLLADCFEALIAAIFLDHSFDKAYQFIMENLFQETLTDIIDKKLYQSPKSKLQEIFQRKHRVTPLYKLIEQKGPEHKRVFTVSVVLKGRILAQGTGTTKKEAEEQAAREALKSML